MYWFDPEMIEEEAFRLSRSYFHDHFWKGYVDYSRFVLCLSEEGQAHFPSVDPKELYEACIMELKQKKEEIQKRWELEVLPIMQERFDLVRDFLTKQGCTIETVSPGMWGNIKNPSRASFDFSLRNPHVCLDSEQHIINYFGIENRNKTNGGYGFRESEISKIENFLEKHLISSPKKYKELKRKLEDLKEFRTGWEQVYGDRFWSTVNGKSPLIFRYRTSISKTHEDIHIHAEDSKKGVIVGKVDAISTVPFDSVYIWIETQQKEKIAIEVGKTPYKIYP